MTADRITAAIDRECTEDYFKHADELWDSLVGIKDLVRRMAVYDKMLQPYKYYKDEWLKREGGTIAGRQQLVDVMKPSGTGDKPFDARPVDSEAYRKLKTEALAKVVEGMDAPEFYGMLDLCKRRAKGKTVEPVHGKEKLIQNVIEAGLLGRLELEQFLAGKVRQG